MIDFLHTDLFLILLFVLNIILLICSVIGNIRIKNIHKNSNLFIKKIGNGKDIKKDLEKYINRVSKSEEEIRNLSLNYKQLEEKTKNCIQKVGIVRYNAYKDTGSDLSFAICLLDEVNDGFVLNGIYSRETSNIYAKPIKNGQSNYIITPEEKEAIKLAIDNKNKI